MIPILNVPFFVHSDTYLIDANEPQFGLQVL